MPRWAGFVPVGENCRRGEPVLMSVDEYDIFTDDAIKRIPEIEE